MKKIAIMTLKQGRNYGGMLQAYALQRTLAALGYDVETSWASGPVVRCIVKLIPGVKRVARTLKGVKKTTSNDSTVTKHTIRFVNKNIRVVGFNKMLVNSVAGKYYAYVVGSDQVWRKLYAYIPHNLLSFVPGKVRRISYAASFGRDDLDEYGDALIAKSKRLARKFDAISVREDSGVDIVKKYWGLPAERHVDPTLLLDAKNYSDLVENDDLPLHESDGELFSYVLDTSPGKQEISDMVARVLDMKTFTVIDGDENSGKPMPPVTQWLKSFMDAKYVVTDSFHGTVFSIIFNKPFIVVGNKERGLARFQSLLKMFDLEDRLVDSADDITDSLIMQPIDWNAVNAKIKVEQKRSMDYLRKYLQ